MIITTVALTLASCSSDTDSSAPVLESHGLAGMDAVEMIDHLDRLPVAERPTDLMASIRHDELLVNTGTEEFHFPLPDDQTYVSIAPFQSQTHDCFYHSLTTCLGELDNEEVAVTITDETTGEVLIDEVSTTFDNGFIGFWLPTEAAGTITIDHDGKSGTTAFSTGEDGATCVTTLQVV